MLQLSQPVVYPLKIVLLGISPMMNASCTCQQQQHSRKAASRQDELRQVPSIREQLVDMYELGFPQSNSPKIFHSPRRKKLDAYIGSWGSWQLLVIGTNGEWRSQFFKLLLGEKNPLHLD